VVAPSGKTLVEQRDYSVVDKRYVYRPPFYPVAQYVDTPSSFDPGDYRFHVVLHDKIAGVDIRFDQPFTLKKP